MTFTRAAQRAEADGIPRCLGCGSKLPTCSYWYQKGGEGWNRKGGTTTWNNEPPTRGKYGDNLICSLECAQNVMARVFSMATEHGWDLRDLLPEEWRPDLVPWDAWAAGTKLNGKRAFVVGRQRKK